jgi:hypothetical protein
MSQVPTYVYLFALAAGAAIAARLMGGRARDDPGSFPGWILYAVAIGCVVIALATIWLEHNA